MKKIILLTDYKNSFGSKWDAKPYRSGFDKSLLKQLFLEKNIQCEFISMSNIINTEFDLKNTVILYTSSEDKGSYYKSFIEDIIMHLEQSGAFVVPSYKYLRAHDNKVFMELLRRKLLNQNMNSLRSYIAGCYEDILGIIEEISFPIVIKTSEGSLSRGVCLANSRNELIVKIKSLTKIIRHREYIKDYLRPFKHKNYKRESIYRKKFILQEFISNLKNDWKILIFGERYYIVERPIRKNDFRASGCGIDNCFFGSKVSLPDGIFDFAEDVFRQANVPHLSIDIAFDGQKFYLLEFQATYFGTAGQVKSDVFFSKNNSKWISKSNDLSIEKIYLDSILFYLNNKI